MVCIAGESCRDPASGRLIGLARAARGLWISCRLADTGDRCRRHDDGTLVLVGDARGQLSPLPLPPRQTPPRIEVRVGPDLGPPAPLPVGDRQLAEIPIRIRNTGTEPVHWLHLVPKDTSQAPFLPPPRLVKLDPGAEHLFTGRVSFAAAYEQPAPAAAALDLALAMDQGEPIPIRVPVAGLAAEPQVVVSLEQVADLRTLTLRLTNRGGQDIKDIWVSARVGTPRGDADLQLLNDNDNDPVRRSSSSVAQRPEIALKSRDRDKSPYALRTGPPCPRSFSPTAARTTPWSAGCNRHSPTWARTSGSTRVNCAAATRCGP